MRRIWLLVGLGMVAVVLAAPLTVFFVRSPVLVVTEASFVALYGEARLKEERTAAGRALFRQVKPVFVVDGVSSDMVIFAINEASPQPACVLFPLSQAQSARRFHEQFPETPAVILNGLVTAVNLPLPDGFLCIYGTDRAVDLYRAGLFAGILGISRRNLALQSEKQDGIPSNSPQTYVFWQDLFMPTDGRELFLRGVRENDPDANVIFINVAAQLPDAQAIACATLTGAGAEFLERSAPIPQVLFSWMNPALVPRDVIVQLDDSVWALAVPAARMAMQQQAEGKIPSRPLIFSQKIPDNSLFRILEKSAKKMP